VTLPKLRNPALAETEEQTGAGCGEPGLSRVAPFPRLPPHKQRLPSAASQADVLLLATPMRVR